MDIGYFHPEKGYWQAVGVVDEDQAAVLLASYPVGTSEVPLKPGPGYEFTDGAWKQMPLPSVAVPDRVTANQFGKQLVAVNILDQVTAWVAQQDAAIQWAFNRSATFVRNDPMMEAGFTNLGFSAAQIDDFFLAASAL